MQSAVGMVFAPLQEVFTSGVNMISGGLSYFTNYSTLEEENEILKQKVLELEKEVRELEGMRFENESLREFIGIVEENEDFDYVYADVIAKDPGSLFYSFTIDKGTNYGIDLYDAVITADGLVGIVSEIGATFSKVMTIVGDGGAIGASVVGTHDICMLEGDIELNAQGLCRLSYLSNNSLAQEGDFVETSGLGELFPAGIVIGEIIEVQAESNNLSKYAVLRPSVDFSDIKDVMVIRGFGVEDEGESEEE